MHYCPKRLKLVHCSVEKCGCKVQGSRSCTSMEHMKVGKPDACPKHQTTSTLVGFSDNVREQISTSSLSPDENMSQIAVQSNSSGQDRSPQHYKEAEYRPALSLREKRMHLRSTPFVTVLSHLLRPWPGLWTTHDLYFNNGNI
ncbi:hypothetical protein TNCV_1905061 [Trichonephila clavipes]|nr:hypothetical protein TNCV_1905061 [Trichonephila clavipes]